MMSAISPARLTLSSTFRSLARRKGPLGNNNNNTRVASVRLSGATNRPVFLSAMASSAAGSSSSLEENPLASWRLGRAQTAGGTPDLPRWNSIAPEHIRPAIAAAVDEALAEIEAIEVSATRVNKKKTDVT